MIIGYTILIAVLVAIDQYSKFLAVEYLYTGDVITVIPHFLGLRYAENTGAAFSIFSNSTTFLIIITSISMIFLVLLLVFYKEIDKIEKFCLALIIAGGVGNLIDRIRLGYVVDMFEFLFMDFAIFNVADSLVCIAAAIGLPYVAYNEYKKSKKGSE